MSERAAIRVARSWSSLYADRVLNIKLEVTFKRV